MNDTTDILNRCRREHLSAMHLTEFFWVLHSLLIQHASKYNHYDAYNTAIAWCTKGYL